MDYKTSKTWHKSNELLEDLQELCKRLAAINQKNLASQIHKFATIAPNQLAASTEPELQKEKLECCVAAHQATVNVHKLLTLARRRQYIDQEVFNHFSQRTIEIHELLGKVIRSQP